MTEGWIILLLPSAVGLWLIGGTWWKPARRVVWPILVGVALVQSGVHLLNTGAVVFALYVVNTLGYGDRTLWIWRWFVLMSYGLPALLLSTHFWWFNLLLCGGLLPLLFWMSRKWNPITHKLFEGFSGICQASTLIVAGLAR